MSESNPAGIFAPQTGAHLHAVAATELLRAIARLGWRGPRLHTGVHQARKSMRRARAVLALGMPALGPGAKLVDRELRRVIRGLSRLRDAHALTGTFDHLLEKESADGDVAALLRRARRGAARARAATALAELADDPQLQERRALLLTLHAAMGGLDWAAVDTACVVAALQHGTKQVEAASVRARASGSDEDWHRWRRRARRLSQQHTALDDAAPATDADAAGKRLAVLLGQAQDYAMLIAGCGRKSGIAKPDRERLRELANTRLTRIRTRIAARQHVSTGSP